MQKIVVEDVAILKPELNKGIQCNCGILVAPILDPGLQALVKVLEQSVTNFKTLLLAQNSSQWRSFDQDKSYNFIKRFLSKLVQCSKY